MDEDIKASYLHEGYAKIKNKKGKCCTGGFYSPSFGDLISVVQCYKKTINKNRRL